MECMGEGDEGRKEVLARQEEGNVMADEGKGKKFLSRVFFFFAGICWRNNVLLKLLVEIWVKCVKLMVYGCYECL